MKVLSPDSIHPPFANYAHGISVTSSHLVATSGQLGIAADGTVPDGAEAQAAVCFASIEAILLEAGLNRGNIVRLNAYVTAREHMTGYMAARDAFLAGTGHTPASTLMIVSGFTRPEFVVEVEALAAKEES
ncbi:MAG: RidA family protein [Pseudomonadota bacterium]